MTSVPSGRSGENSKSISLPLFEFNFSSNVVLKIKLNPVPAIFSLLKPVRIGATNEGLKVVSQKLDGNKLIIDCEGLPGHDYELGITNEDKVKNVEGAVLKNGILKIGFDENGSDFIRHEIIVTLIL